MNRLIFSLLILAVAFFDMAYTIWAVRRYHFREQNRMWNEAVYFPRSFVLRYTAYHVVALAVCWPTFPLELYWIVLAVRVFINAKNIAAVRKARGKLCIGIDTGSLGGDDTAVVLARRVGDEVYIEEIKTSRRAR